MQEPDKPRGGAASEHGGGRWQDRPAAPRARPRTRYTRGTHAATRTLLRPHHLWPAAFGSRALSWMHSVMFIRDFNIVKITNTVKTFLEETITLHCHANHIDKKDEKWNGTFLDIVKHGQMKKKEFPIKTHSPSMYCWSLSDMARLPGQVEKIGKGERRGDKLELPFLLWLPLVSFYFPCQ